MHSRRALLVSGCLFLSSLSLAGQGDLAGTRVYGTAQAAVTQFGAMATDVARADLLFVGEEHEDLRTHGVELRLLEEIAARRGDVILLLQMFGRDAQEPLDHLQMGHLGAEDFVREARAWPAYARDYKPLVDFAIAKKWPVIAASAPSAIVGRVAEQGASALEALSSDERALVAADRRCSTDDAYYRRFAAGLKSGQPGFPALPAGASVDRLYLAHCLEDETMAETMAQMHVAGSLGGKQPLVILINGAAHSDYRQGVVERTSRRLPGKRAAVISILPVASLNTLDTSAAARQRADYLVFSVK